MQPPKLDILLYLCNRRGIRFEMGESIATYAMILPGVSIAEGAVVASGSVVTREVPTYTIVAGGAAAPIGARNQQTPLTIDAFFLVPA